MWQKQQNIKFLLLLLGAVLCLPSTWCLSDKRLCADLKCETIISTGTARLNYNAAEDGILSFKIHAPIRILSKSAGTDPSLWGVEISGRRGYVNKDHILEKKVFVRKNDLIEVPVVPIVTKANQEQPAQPTTTTVTGSDSNVETKPNSTVQAASLVLNDSENNIGSRADNSTGPAATTAETVSITSPLEDINVNGEKPTIITNTLENEPEKPAETTPVKSNVQVVDGTEIPLSAYTTDVGEQPPVDISKLNDTEIVNTVENDDDDDDDKYEVYDDNDNEIDSLNTELGTKSILTPNKQQVKNVEVELKSKTETTIQEKQNDTNTEKIVSNVDVTPNENTANGDVKVTKTEKDPKISEIIVDKDEAKKDSAPSISIEELPEEMRKNAKNSALTAEDEIKILTTTESSQAKSESIKPAKDLKVPNDVNISKIDDAITFNQTKQEVINNKEVHTDLSTTKASTESIQDIQQQDTIVAQMPIAKISEEQPTLPSVEQKETILAANTTTIPISTTTATANDSEAIDDNKGPINELEGSRNPTIIATEEPIVEATATTLPDENVETILSREEPSVTEATTTTPTVPQLATVDPNRAEELKTVHQIPTAPSGILPLFRDSNIAERREQQQQQHHHENYDLNQHDPYRQNDGPYKPPLHDYPPPPASPPTLDQVTPNQNEQVAQADSNPDSSERASQAELPQQEQQRTEVDQTAEIIGVGSLETVHVQMPQSLPTTLPPLQLQESTVLPTIVPTERIDSIENKDSGLFATILNTVKGMLPSNGGDKFERYTDQADEVASPAKTIDVSRTSYHENANGYCERAYVPHDFSIDNFIETMANKVLENIHLLACIVVAATSSLFFIFGYYCFCNSSQEGALLAKLNILERSLLATHKENAILKHDLIATRMKLSSIEDNSFGSNDMVMALKKELEELLYERGKLQEQVSGLEKELEVAAEAGLELNKIVSELLANQSGDESIISSVEELQRQLNEQQNTILEINANLAEKSRENSELQLMIAEQNVRLGGELASVQQDNDELEAEKNILQTRLDELKAEFDGEITKALEGKNLEIQRIQSQIVELNLKWETEHNKLQTSLAKVEALEDCLKTFKKGPNVNVSEMLNVANVRAELIDAQKKQASLKARLENELEAKSLIESQQQIASTEMEKLKKDFNQTEKDKLEAQTRLEVLSNYFKEKETQLQKELSLKEAMWLKQQGETTGTVDRLTAMQDEIHTLKSQNDALRAEIEAQLAAHKAQTGTLENRAHEYWLAARQTDRRCEEARAEAAALRRKLTAIAGGEQVGQNITSNGTDTHLNAELKNAPSPLPLDSPGSPLLGRLPPPPASFLQQTFMGPPVPHFMNFPPPPPPLFVPPGEMRPAPLGRIMSPPPHLRSDRYSELHGDYSDYDDDDEDDREVNHHRRRRSGSSWHRDSYSPAPRTYRSLSPSESRYNYADTETDFSPPNSPRHHRNSRPLNEV